MKAQDQRAFVIGPRPQLLMTPNAQTQAHGIDRPLGPAQHLGNVGTGKTLLAQSPQHHPFALGPGIARGSARIRAPTSASNQALKTIASVRLRDATIRLRGEPRDRFSDHDALHSCQDDTQDSRQHSNRPPHSPAVPKQSPNPARISDRQVLPVNSADLYPQGLKSSPISR